MNAITDEMLRSALGIKDDAPLTPEQLVIYDEWTTCLGLELLKVDVFDPRLFEYIALYDKCEMKKDTRKKEALASIELGIDTKKN